MEHPLKSRLLALSYSTFVMDFAVVCTTNRPAGWPSQEKIMLAIMMGDKMKYAIIEYKVNDIGNKKKERKREEEAQP
jgi:hypothetical protein